MPHHVARVGMRGKGGKCWSRVSNNGLWHVATAAVFVLQSYLCSSFEAPCGESPMHGGVRTNREVFPNAESDVDMLSGWMGSVKTEVNGTCFLKDLSKS